MSNSESKGHSSSPAPKASENRGKKKPATPLAKFLNWAERMIYPLAVLTSVVGLCYWYWTTTPSYALTSVMMAVNNHDTKNFEKYVDIDNIVGRAFDDVVDGPARTMIMGRYDSMIGAGFLRFFKNDIVGMAHDKVVSYVGDEHTKLSVSGTNSIAGIPLPFTISKTQHENSSTEMPKAELPAESASAKPVAANSAKDGLPGSKPTSKEDTSALVNDDYNATTDIPEIPGVKGKVKDQIKQFARFREFKYFEQKGNAALLGLEFYSPKLHENWVLEFKMEDAGGFWRVTEVSNLNQLIDKYLALHEKHLI